MCWMAPNRLLFLSTLSLRRATWQRGSRITYVEISIHALLAESDHHLSKNRNQGQQFLSTLSLRRATRSKPTEQTKTFISIHALLAESDSQSSAKSTPEEVFLSTLSLRRATGAAPPAPRGKSSFLSTLSLRRATPVAALTSEVSDISIHALLAESDLGLVFYWHS